MSALIVVAVSVIAGAALYRIDKNAERNEKENGLARRQQARGTDQ
jgi:hypothetical protein